MNILEEIIACKKQEVEQAKSLVSLETIKKLASSQKDKRPFFNTIQTKVNKKEPALIAEIKKASPSKGIIKENFNPVKIAKSYKSGGAVCLSVLTDRKYFQGNIEYLKQIKEIVDLPVLRKDFIVDPYQIYESKYNQADCILLIVRAFSEISLLHNLYKIAIENNLDCLIEVHDEREMEIALNFTGEVPGPHLLGINNRDLKTFNTTLETTKKLVSKYKKDLMNKLIVSESGIFSFNDIKTLMDSSVYAYLVGESLIKENDIEIATRKLIGVK